MKRLLNLLAGCGIAALFIVMLLALAGCSSTTTICEFDAAGKLVRETKTKESLPAAIIRSTQNKTVVMWEDGWAGYISASPGTQEDPSPHGKIFVGKVNKGYIGILPGQQNVADIAKIVQATKTDLAVGFDGMKSQSSETASTNAETATK